MTNDDGHEIGHDDKTHPGLHRLSEGTPETRALSELATMVAFYSGRLEQLVGEVQRNGMTDGQRGVLVRDLREVGRDFVNASERLAQRR
jgi:hypothetical protein